MGHKRNGLYRCSKKETNYIVNELPEILAQVDWYYEYEKYYEQHQLASIILKLMEAKAEQKRLLELIEDAYGDD